jgi:hypothetical protein
MENPEDPNVKATLQLVTLPNVYVAFRRLQGSVSVNEKCSSSSAARVVAP